MRFLFLIKKAASLSAAYLLAVSIMLTGVQNILASAENSDTFSPLADHENEKGVYSYHFDGKLTNPCNESSIREKANVIGDFWFEFTYLDNNGTGEQHTEKFDMSYNGSENNNNAFLREHFVRPNDDETGLSFDMNIPGQLTKMKIHLEMNGWLGWFSYERLSFEINTVTVNGIKVNSSTDNVSSSVGSSDGTIVFLMDKPDSSLFAEAFGVEEITLGSFNKMVESGELDEVNVPDKYGAILTEQALIKITEITDSSVNQSFSHSDEQGMYLYTLKMQIDNPVNTNSAAGDSIKAFIIDFTYNESEHYKLDMSWDDQAGKNRNAALANLFFRPDDNETKAVMNVWIPGRVSKINVLLNMSGGERLSVTFSDVLLAGFKVNRKTESVSSAFFESTAELECSVPETLIDLSGLSDEQITEVMDIIYKADESTEASGIKDQLGSVIGGEQLKNAHEDMMKCISAAENDSRAEYADVIDGFYMYKTIYRAERINAVQEYIIEKRTEFRSKYREYGE